MTGPTTFKVTKDNAVSTTATSYASTGVTATTVATGEGAKFPSTFPFRLDIWAGVGGSDPSADANYEQVTVTARTGDVLTHSATTKTHSAGGTQINVMLPQDAADVSDTQTAVNNLEGGNLPFNSVSSTSTLPTTGVEYGLSGNITATLPVVSAGKYYMLKKTDTAANTITLQGSGGALIEGASTYLMTYQNQSVFLVFDGTNWQVMAIQVPGLFGLVQNEVPGGTPNGSLTAFTTASKFQTNSLRVYRNGIRLKGGGVDFTEAAGTQGFTMVTAPSTGDLLQVDYNIYNATFMQGSNSTITNEQPTGSVNGSNTSFICARAFISGTLEVMLDGRILKRGTDYTETTPGSGTFTMTVAPYSGQEILVNYQFNLNPSSNADAVDGVHASPTGGQSGQLIADYGGWWLSSDALTFVTSTTATMLGDVTGRYQQGDKFKFDNPATKYLYLRALSYNSGTGLTTLTFYGGSGTTIANSSITNVYYSRVASPLGFPAFMTDTNAGAAGGDINVEIIGKHIRMWGLTSSLSITNGAAVAFTITFPFTIAAGARMVGQCADMTVSAASVMGQVSSSPTTTNGNGQVYNNSGSTITAKYTWAVDGSL